MTDCGECGKEDCDPVYTECCGVWMCDSCHDYHMNYWYEDWLWDGEGKDE